jgi:hypothetical protein
MAIDDWLSQLWDDYGIAAQWWVDKRVKAEKQHGRVRWDLAWDQFSQTLINAASVRKTIEQEFRGDTLW